VIAVVIFWNLYTFIDLSQDTLGVSSNDKTGNLLISTASLTGGSKSTDMYDWLKSKPAKNAVKGNNVNSEIAHASESRPQQHAQSQPQQLQPPQLTIQQISLERQVSSIASNVEKIHPAIDNVREIVERIEATLSWHQSAAVVLSADPPPSPASAQVKQTLLLPLGPNDFERFENLYLSMKKFFAFEEVQEWLIVTPNKESELVSKIDRLTHAHKHLIRVMEDTEVVPKLKELPTTNW
jgi:hypothetical protein